MKSIKVVKAKKTYICNLTGKTINVGENYKRVNINFVGIFHFKLNVKDEDIIEYINDKYGEEQDTSYYCSSYYDPLENGGY